MVCHRMADINDVPQNEDIDKPTSVYLILKEKRMEEQSVGARL